MKLLLTQQEYLKPPNFWTMDMLERSWYDLLHGHEIRAAPNDPEIFTIPDWDCLILTGGQDSLARHVTENHLMQMCLDHGIPMIGICHGAFAINDYLGGTNGTIQGHKRCEHEVIMQDEKYLVNSYHEQRLASLAQALIPCAHDLDGNIEAFEHTSRPIWGMVWHPERMATPVLLPSVVSFLQKV